MQRSRGMGVLPVSGGHTVGVPSSSGPPSGLAPSCLVTPLTPSADPGQE